MSSFRERRSNALLLVSGREKTHYGVSDFCECIQLETLLLVNEDCLRDISLWRAC